MQAHPPATRAGGRARLGSWTANEAQSGALHRARPTSHRAGERRTAIGDSHSGTRCRFRRDGARDGTAAKDVVEPVESCRTEPVISVACGSQEGSPQLRRRRQLRQRKQPVPTTAMAAIARGAAVAAAAAAAGTAGELVPPPTTTTAVAAVATRSGKSAAATAGLAGTAPGLLAEPSPARGAAAAAQRRDGIAGWRRAGPGAGRTRGPVRRRRWRIAARGATRRPRSGCSVVRRTAGGRTRWCTCATAERATGMGPSGRRRCCRRRRRQRRTRRWLTTVAGHSQALLP